MDVIDIGKVVEKCRLMLITSVFTLPQNDVHNDLDNNRIPYCTSVNDVAFCVICAVYPMVLILDGNSEIRAHVRSNL